MGNMKYEQKIRTSSTQDEPGRASREIDSVAGSSITAGGTFCVLLSILP